MVAVGWVVLTGASETLTGASVVSTSAEVTTSDRGTVVGIPIWLYVVGTTVVVVVSGVVAPGVVAAEDVEEA